MRDLQSITQPSTEVIKPKTITTLYRFAINKIDGKWPNRNSEDRKIVRFHNNPHSRSRSYRRGRNGNPNNWFQRNRSKENFQNKNNC
jgi:hypothetical protein